MSKADQVVGESEQQSMLVCESFPAHFVWVPHTISAVIAILFDQTACI